MATALESKAALSLVTVAGMGAVVSLFEQSLAQPEQQRAYLLETVPSAIEYYSFGAAALAADFYDDEREREAAPRLYIAEPIIADRVIDIRRAVAWASEPLFDGATDVSLGRLADVVQLETSRPYRDTITINRSRDPAAVGWRRIARASSCRFCKMLADKGAVYIDRTARFAAHGHCQCTAQPVFSSSEFGEEANALQYMASKRNRTPAQKAQLREYLLRTYPSDNPRKSPVTARIEKSPLAAKDPSALAKNQLAVLGKSLPELQARAAAGENLGSAIKWQQERIAVLERQLSSK